MDTKPKRVEPERLRRGKRFHKKIQKDWHDTAEGEIESEKTVTKPTGRKGRVDVFARDDDNAVAVVEIKASDWDAMKEAAVRRNVKRQARQVWDYIESQLEKEEQVSPGIIFPKRPKDPARLKLIEELFEDEGIVAVWDDESIAELKARIG